MRIGCLQFAPRVADVSNNMTRAEAVLSKVDPKDLEKLDLLVLPEMAFSGYNFKSVEAIEPCLEPTASGVSSRWARATALKYGCAVAVGYPERTDASEYYNSLVVVDSGGETVAKYRKSFLYYTDANWAREGQGFYGGKMGRFGQVAIGICMDINPYKFEAPWDAYEFAFHVLKVQANLVIFSMAWLTNDERSMFLSSPHDPDLSTISYWARRLDPIVRTESSDEVIFVFCNRCGVEDDATYAGTSVVMGIKDGEVSIYGLLGRGTEKLLLVDTDKPPFGKLVDRPPTEENGAEDDAPQGEPTQPRGAPPNGSNRRSTSLAADSPTLPSTGFAPRPPGDT
ncbi:hypothetical protein VTK26DRAFT_3242 [Humicola hyalothermophila]